MAMFPVKWGKALDRTSEAAEEENEVGVGDGVPGRPIHLSGVDPRGRIVLAV